MVLGDNLFTRQVEWSYTDWVFHQSWKDVILNIKMIIREWGNNGYWKKKVLEGTEILSDYEKQQKTLLLCRGNLYQGHRT